MIAGPAFAIAIAFAAAPQVPEPESPAVVAGRVVDASTGRPIAGAVITASGSAVAIPGASSPVRVMTSAGGGFALRGVSKGALVLTAVKGGYVDGQPGQRRPGGSVQPIRVADGQRITDVEIRMWRFASMAGTVVDEAGDPVVNTRVRALQRTFVSGRARFSNGPMAVTDDRGQYRIGGLTPGDYTVTIPSTQTSVPADLMESFYRGTPLSDANRFRVSREMNAIGSSIAPSGSQYAMRSGSQTFSLATGTLTPITAAGGTFVYPTVYYPFAAVLADASVITLRSGDERNGIDFQVKPARGMRVSGTLLGPDGPSAITGVRLAAARDTDALSPIDVATTMTDWAGGFTFPSVPPGQYVLRVTRFPQPPVDVENMSRVSVVPGGAMTITSNPTAPPSGPPPVPPDATLIAQMPIVVVDTAIDDLMVPLVPAPRFSGRVEFAGTAERPSADQIVGLRIAADRVDGMRLPESPIPDGIGRPESNGQFSTYGVPPGRYVLRVTPAPAGWYLQSAVYEGRDIADLPLDVETKDIASVVITFTDRPSSVAGSVSGTQGATAAAVVIAYPTDEAMWTTSPRRLRTARAAPDGSYSIQALPAGEYYVVAVEEDRVGEWQDPALLRALARFAQTVQVVEGDRKMVNLRAAAIR